MKGLEDAHNRFDISRVVIEREKLFKKIGKIDERS